MLLFSIFELQLNPDVNVFQRKFVNEVRRCEEMDRKLSELFCQYCWVTKHDRQATQHHVFWLNSMEIITLSLLFLFLLYLTCFSFLRIC